MTSSSKVYIVGVGCTRASSDRSSGKSAIPSLVSAATKALLDAGITYDSVTHGVRGENVSVEAFKAFDEGDISVDKAKSGSEVDSAFRLVKDRGAQCVLLMTLEERTATSHVLVSEQCLWRHPYLRDSAVLVQESNSGGSQKGDLQDLCQKVWILRGWSKSSGAEAKDGKMTYHRKQNGSFQLSRADKGAVPKWEEVEHRQDGKYRLRYNPATETREICREDFDAVKADGKNNRKFDGKDFDRKGGDRAALEAKL